MPALIVVAVLAVIAAIVLAVVRSARAERERRLEIARALGFTPIEPTPEFNAKINELYESMRVDRRTDGGARYTLRNVLGRHSEDAEVFLFDLSDRSGDAENRTERQAVLVVSGHLDLPPFVVFPRPELEGALAKLSNALLGWVIARWGDPVEFPDAPDFERRYLVSSPEPDRTRRFLDDGRLRRLADTRLLNIHAGGDMLTVARIDPTATSVTLETVSARVDEALAIFAVMRTGSETGRG